jgi:hypothetical protein
MFVPDLHDPSVTWNKSSFSSTNGCVEVAFVGNVVAVRDSKDNRTAKAREAGQAGHGSASRPVLIFDQTEWTAFLRGVRRGEFDLPEERGRMTRKPRSA